MCAQTRAGIHGGPAAKLGRLKASARDGPIGQLT